MGLYSPKIISGETLVPDFQYQRFSPAAKAEFVRVRTASCFMWRYKDASTPFFPPKVETKHIDTDDILQRWEFDEKTLYNNFLDVLTDPKGVSLIEGDDDEDFTYGILCIVLADMNYQEMDWLLVKEFGNIYSLRLVGLTDSDEERYSEEEWD